jgi:hypothetical protein
MSDPRPPALRGGKFTLAMFVIAGLLAMATSCRGHRNPEDNELQRMERARLESELAQLEHMLADKQRARRWSLTNASEEQDKREFLNSDYRKSPWPRVQVGPKKFLTTEPRVLEPWIAEARAKIARLDALAATPRSHAPVGVVPPMLEASWGERRLIVKNIGSEELQVIPLLFPADDAPEMVCGFDSDHHNREQHRGYYDLAAGETREYRANESIYGHHCGNKGKYLLAFEIQRRDATIWASNAVLALRRQQLTQELAELERALGESPPRELIEAPQR